MNLATEFEIGLSYHDFLARHGTDDQRARWKAFHTQVQLTDSQKELLGRFTRDMKVFVLAGAWCGDCVNQCPIFDHFAQRTPRIQLRFFDRDAHPELAERLRICGGARVPVVLFASEDDFEVGWFGDRTLAKYRSMAGTLQGPTCSTGIGRSPADLHAAVIQEWLDQFERAQLILRTSARLRQKHSD